MTLSAEDRDKLFCMNAKKYRLKRLLLKAVAMRESSLNERAYRFEPGFWERYLKDKPEWKDQDPKIVSASYGLMQLMWTTAWGLGFRGTQEDLWNPVYNIELGAKLIRKILDSITTPEMAEYFWLSPIAIALARYNGGARDNPDMSGELRNGQYAMNVLGTWEKLKKTEKECTDDD